MSTSILAIAKPQSPLYLGEEWLGRNPCYPAVALRASGETLGEGLTWAYYRTQDSHLHLVSSIWFIPIQLFSVLKSNYILNSFAQNPQVLKPASTSSCNGL